MLYLIVGVVYVTVCALALALCRAAANGDRLADPPPITQLRRRQLDDMVDAEYRQ